MKQSKEEKDQLRERLLKDFDVWDFPPSEWEADLVKELIDMPWYLIPRAPPDVLKKMGLPFNECHQNTRWFAKNESTGTFKSIAGWMVEENRNFVLHSVVKDENGYLCITPSFFEEAKITFIPDDKITWQPEGDRLAAYRNGQKIGPGVRRLPRETMIMNAAFRERLKGGMDPVQAMEFTPEEWEEAMKKYGA